MLAEMPCFHIQSYTTKFYITMWLSYKKGFKAYLQLEKSLSDNSVDAYLHDLDKLTTFLAETDELLTPSQVNLKILESFTRWINELGMTPGSQARIISGLKSFFKFCLQEQIIQIDPSCLLESPKLKRALPDVLSFEEIEQIISKLDLSKRVPLHLYINNFV